MTDHANELRRHARKIPHPQGETPGVMLRAADEIERLQRVIASPYSMTRDDVIRLAREAGLLIPSFRIDGGLALGACTVPDFERFATLVAAAEREACAKACEDLRAKVAEMERQEPVGTLHDDGCFVWRETAPHHSNYAGWKMVLYALLGAQPAPRVPDGWKLVPIEPTPDMLAAAILSSHALKVHRAGRCYRAMIAAAPEAKP